MQIDEMIKKFMEYAKEDDSRLLEVGKLLRAFYDNLDGEDGVKSQAQTWSELRATLKEDFDALVAARSKPGTLPASSPI